MNITTAVFDLDGTLLDTVGDLAYASNKVLRSFGFAEHPEDAYNTFVGDGLHTLMTRIVPPAADEDTIKRCCSLFVEVYATCWDRTTQPYAGIDTMLGELKRQGVSCCVLSNKPHPFTVKCVDRYFNNDVFNHVFGQREGVQRKPDPAGAFEIMKMAGCEPDQCIYIGDTSVDMQTGKNAGMFTIGVLWGFRGRQELVDNGADLIVGNPSEIVEYVVSTR